jgi:hypothetical protein
MDRALFEKPVLDEQSLAPLTEHVVEIVTTPFIGVVLSGSSVKVR